MPTSYPTSYPTPDSPARRAVAGQALTLRAAALALALCPALVACGSAATGESTPTSTTTAEAHTAGAPSAPATGTAALQVVDAWAKAQPDPAAMPMTGVFATVRNPGAEPVGLVSAATSASARTEIHTTVTEGGAPVMKAVPSLTIPAGGSLLLRPGGDHVMVLDLTTPLAAGDTVTVTLRGQDGRSVSFDAVAKAFTGANERYHGGGSGDTGSMSPSS